MGGQGQRSQTPSSIWRLMINVNADTAPGQPAVEGERDEIGSAGKEDLGGRNLLFLFYVRLVGTLISFKSLLFKSLHLENLEIVSDCPGRPGEHCVCVGG